MSSFAGDGVFHFIDLVIGNFAKFTNGIPVIGGPTRPHFFTEHFWTTGSYYLNHKKLLSQRFVPRKL